MDNTSNLNLTWNSWSSVLILNLLILSVTIQYGCAHDVECPVMWTEFDQFCYISETETHRTYDDAQLDCYKHGADLASIISTDERDFLFNTFIDGIITENIWIGLNDKDAENTFVWQDGNTLVNLDHLVWRTKNGIVQPDNGGGPPYPPENCVHLFSLDAEMNDRPCEDVYPYICKMKRTHFWIESAQYIAKEGTTLSVTVHRDGLIANDDRITLTTPGVADTADIGTDYESPTAGMPTATAITLEFPPGEGLATVMYPIKADTLIEDMEFFTLTLALSEGTADGSAIAGIYATVDSPSTSMVHIVDCTAVFWIEETVYTTKEDSTLMVIIHREGNLANEDHLTLTADGGTATYSATAATDDYTSESNPGDAVEMVDFEAGDTTVTVIYTINKDTLVEGTETITLGLALSGTTATGMAAKLVSPNSATIYIMDCTALFWIDEFQYAAKENSDLEVTIRRGGNLDNADQLTLTVNGGTATYSATPDTDDYTSESNPDDAVETIDFDPGDTTATVTYTINKDTIIEDLETIDLLLELSDTTDMTYAAVGSPSTATVYVMDCTTYFWIEENQCIAFEATTLTVTFHRGGYLGREDSIAVSYTDARAENGADYSPMDTDPVTFAEGATTSTKIITIDADNELEYNEMFNIAITIPSDPTMLDKMASLYSPSMKEVIIKDPTWYELDCANYNVPESSGPVEITILRKGDTRSEGHVSLTTVDKTASSSGDFGEVVGMQVAFDADQLSATVEITINPDLTYEGNEQFQVFLHDSDAPEALGDLQKAMVTIYDDDDPDIDDDDDDTGDIQTTYKFQRAVYHVTESTRNISVGILRVGTTMSEIAGSVEISTKDMNDNMLLTAEDGSDFNGFENIAIDFEINDGIEHHLISLADGVDVDKQEYFEVCLANPVSGIIDAPECAIIYIEDDDCEVSFGDAFYTIMEGTRIVNVKVQRRGYLRRIDSVDVVSSPITATEGLTKDYPPVHHTVVFGANDHPQEATTSFEIEVRDDQLVENTEYFQLELVDSDGCSIGEPSIAEVAIADNDVSYRFLKDEYSVSESEKKVVLYIMRDGYLGQESTIGLFTRDISTTSTGPNQDYTLEELSNEIRFAPDEVFQEVSISITDDVTFEDTEKFEVILASDVNERLSIPNKAVVTIFDNNVKCASDCRNGFCINPGECQCFEGYTGALCDEDINECEIQPSVCTSDGMYCRNEIGSYVCVCNNPSFVAVGNVCVRDTKHITGYLLATEYNDLPIEFVDELYDVKSDEFKFWADTLEPELRSAFGGLDGFQDVSLSRLYPTEEGFLGVEYDVTVTSSSQVDETDLNNRILSNINPDGYLGNSVVSLIISPDACPADFCLNGGICAVLLNGGVGCICDIGFTGDQCQILFNDGSESTSISGAVIIWTSSGCLLLIIFIIIVCVFGFNVRRRRYRRRRRAPVLILSRPIGVNNRNRIAPAFPSLLYGYNLGR